MYFISAPREKSPILPQEDPEQNQIIGSSTNTRNADKRFRALKTDLGPPKIFKTFTRPPYAGPYAFSRIPKPHWNRPRVNVLHELPDTWLFVNTNAG